MTFLSVGNKRIPAWLWMLSLFLGVLLPTHAVQVANISGTNMFWDSSVSLNCNYIQYRITNNTATTLSNLWIKVDTFSGSHIFLGGNDPGLYNLGTLAGNSANNSVYFYFQATNTTTTPETHVVHVYQGYPGANGVELTNQSFSLNVVQPGNNQANKISAVLLSPAQPVLGGQFTIEVDGATSTMNGGSDVLYFIPAANTNWLANAFNLMNTRAILTNNGSVYFFTNQLLLTSPGSANKANNYISYYTFRAQGTTTATATNSPDGVFQTGGGFNHSTLNNGVVIPSIPPPTNAMVLTNFASVSQLYTNEIIFITNRFYNVSSLALQLDRVVDTLPAGFLYVTNSSRFAGTTIGNPAVAGQTNTWSEPLTVPANGTADLVFQATPTGTATMVTNYTVAFIGSAQIDRSVDTSDAAPATNVLRVLWQPGATNDTGTTLEDTALTVTAPGVLANDTEPNGFTLTVISYTQPTHGSVTVTANGAYTYLPATNYNGTDSFTYTLTNGNARASTATVNLTITAVNDPPSFTAGANQTVLEDAGAQTVANWATAISTGPSDESAQTITFYLTNNNPSLFAVQPAVSASGTLTYTPAANANGSATVTIYAQDSGGTLNGGSNVSATNTFTITLTAVNDPPSFTPGANQTVLEDAGPQTVVNWASNISTGPANESSQTLTFQVSNNNSSLFSVPPAVSASGTLTYTPATNANGSATVTIYAQDNGGTLNGGSDVSATNTFTVTVTPVNDPPTMTALTNVVATENGGAQTVNLSGISAGPTNESSQTLTLTATSSNPALVPNPSVNYTSPASTGSLIFTPNTNVYGDAIITLILQDDGGTANGGINAITNTFTIHVQTVTNVWASGASLSVNISDATNQPGTGYSQTNYTGFLDLTAASTNPFVLHLNSLAGSQAGVAANFNNNSNYVWTIATTSHGVLEFDPAKVTVDTSSFVNDLAGGTFSVSTNNNSVLLVFTANHPPIASPLVFSRAWGTTLRIPINYVLTNSTTDPDGDSTALLGLGASTNNTAITTNTTYVFFTPTNNVPESFTYTVRDVRSYRPGDTVRTATAWVTVTVTNATSSAVGVASAGGALTVQFAGVPGYTYDVERASSLAGPWVSIWTTNAPAHGLWKFTDSSPPQPSAYYRLHQH